MGAKNRDTNPFKFIRENGPSGYATLIAHGVSSSLLDELIGEGKLVEVHFKRPPNWPGSRIIGIPHTQIGEKCHQHS